MLQEQSALVGSSGEGLQPGTQAGEVSERRVVIVRDGCLAAFLITNVCLLCYSLLPVANPIVTACVLQLSCIPF